MLKIKTSDFKEFFRRTSSIKQTGILPILDYIKLEVDAEGTAFLYDTNMGIWCVHEIKVETDKKAEMLLDKRLLAALVSSTASDLINIKQSGKEIVLTDSDKKGNMLSFKIPDGEHYPKFPQRDETTKTNSSLPPEFIQYLAKAKLFVKTEQEDYFSYVHIIPKADKTVMAASEGHILFYRDFDLQMPGMLLSAECANIITMYDAATHYAVGNYDFFDFGATIYGFVKTEFKSPPFDQLVKNFSANQHFSIAKSELLAFVSLALKVSPLTYTLFNIEKDALEDDSVKLIFHLPQYGILCEKTIPVESNFDVHNSTFNGKQQDILLKTIQSDTINFYSVGPAYFLKDDKDEKLLLMVQGYDPKVAADLQNEGKQKASAKA